MTFDKDNLIKTINQFKDIVPYEGSSHTYITTNTDPQLEMLFNPALKQGYYEFTFEYSLIVGEAKDAKLYLDSGNGYNESEIVLLPKSAKNKIEVVFFANKNVKRIRFDFTEEAGIVFTVKCLLLKKISKLSLFGKLSEVVAVQNNNEHHLINYLKTAAILFRKNGDEVINQLNGSTWGRLNYQKWVEAHDTLDNRELIDIIAEQQQFHYRPLISIILPTYNTPAKWLAECIDSVINQAYPNWELNIADDNSTLQETKDTIITYATKDKRIRYKFRDHNGHIVECSNTALNMSAGVYVTFLDHDDRLAPLALYRIVEALNTDQEIDFLYSDEDKIDEKGNRSSPFFKPDWSPGLFYCQNYIAHLACIRKSLIDVVGGFTAGSEGSQDYDLFLKVMLQNPKIKHLPFVLYHWRQHPGSTSMTNTVKPYAHEAGKKALEKFCAAKYPHQFSHIVDGDLRFTYKPVFKFATDNKISIIIPTKDKIEYLEPCIKSIIEKSTWKNFEILVLNNNSTEEATFTYFKKIQQEHSNVIVLDASFEFNWSKLNNFGAAHAHGNYFIFLNNDISVISPDWMEQLCGWASLHDVATVGANLLYEDNTIQHAGVVVGLGGWADHVFKNTVPEYFSNPFVSNNIPRNVLAVTGACTAIEKSKFDTLGRFDENFIICGSDVELGIRAHKNGLFNVVNSYVQLYHYESKSRGSAVPEADFIQSSIKYEPYRTQQCDPYYNPNLSLLHTSPICKL